ncbi:MAG: 30S ribosomal protein S6 [Chloroflexota bacterium]|nr:30S ribosomal protein S6 [Chloroflexota bacterium]
MRTYELVFIAHPSLEEEGLQGVVDDVKGFVTEAGGNVVDVDHMGRRRLAYAIRNLWEGYYVLVHADLEPSAVAGVEHELNLREDILRYLLIRLDEEE